MADSVKCFAEVQVDDASCSSPLHRCCNPIIERHQKFVFKDVYILTSRNTGAEIITATQKVIRDHLAMMAPNNSSQTVSAEHNSAWGMPEMAAVGMQRAGMACSAIPNTLRGRLVLLASHGAGCVWVVQNGGTTGQKGGGGSQEYRTGDRANAGTGTGIRLPRRCLLSLLYL